MEIRVCQPWCEACPSLTASGEKLTQSRRLHASYRWSPEGRIGCSAPTAVPPAEREPGLPGPIPLAAQLDRHMGQQST